MLESWKDIDGYKGIYQISSKGRVRSSYFDKILAPQNDSRGYFRVWLYRGKTRKRFRVHRLVAKAFIPNPKRKRLVNHKDSDRGNNDMENLEWATPKGNMNHKFVQLKRNKQLLRCLCPNCRKFIESL